MRAAAAAATSSDTQLGDEARLSSQLEVVDGYGEAPAREQGGVADGAEAPEWRRVDVTLDRRVSLRLEAPGD